MQKFTLFVLSVFAVACTKSARPPRDTLVIAIGAQPASMDPRLATDAYGMRISSLLFSSLVRLGPDLQPVGDAAESWVVHGHTYTFSLKPNLRFHNGRALTKDDVEFSFAQYLDSGGPFSSMLDTVKNIHAREVSGRLFVDIEIKNLSDRFLKTDLPSIKILPKNEILAPASTFSHDLIGSGPFRLLRQDAAEIELEAVHGTTATRKLLFKIIRDDFTRYQKMMKGDIDIAQSEISVTRIHDFEKQPKNFQVLFYPGLTMTYLLPNFRDPLLRRYEVRKALAQALQRSDLIRYKMDGLAHEATSILTPNNPYFNSSLANIESDPERALEVIRSLQLSGKDLVLKTANAPEAIDAGKVLAHQMSATGLHVQLQSYEWGTFYSDVKRGGFQLALMRWVGTVDPEIYRSAFQSHETPPGRNRGSYSNPEVDRLLEQAERAEDFRSRKKIFDRIQSLILKDLAIIPLWYDQQIAIAGRNVINYHPSTTGDYWPFTEASKAHE